jgi:hypothetical protein
MPSLHDELRMNTYRTDCVFGDVVPCRLVETDWNFKGAYSLHHQAMIVSVCVVKQKNHWADFDEI